MIQRFRPVLSATLPRTPSYWRVFTPCVATQAGESGVGWLYVAPVLTAAAIGLFLAVRRPENAVGTLISLSGAALATLGTVNGWMDVVEDTMQPAAVGVWVREE